MNSAQTIAMLTITFLGLTSATVTAVSNGAAGAREPREVQGGAGTSVQRQTPKTDFGSVVAPGVTLEQGAVLAQSRELKQRVVSEAARGAAAAQAFGRSLTVTERRELQDACTALVANENDLRAQRQLQSSLERYKDANPEAVLRFCVDREYRQLQRTLQSSVQRQERSATIGEDSQLANVDLQDMLQKQNHQYEAISKIMKTRHDTAKNAISNVR